VASTLFQIRPFYQIFQLDQACQTQTNSRAENALKTDKGATKLKVLKSPLCGPYFTKSND